MDHLTDLVVRSQAGDLDAYGRVVERTQRMAQAIAFDVLRDASLAEDAAQEAYVRAFRRLGDVQDPNAFPGWFRRIVVTVALNARRARRHTWLCLDDIADVPVLDEAETTWSEQQRARLAAALLTLAPDERRLCDRRYHGQWGVGRLTREAGVDQPAMRKRLQRVRDKLRREMEMNEERAMGSAPVRPDFPARIVELLARPRLNDLPENPVGQILAMLRRFHDDFDTIDLPEIVDFETARATIGDDAL